MAEKLIPRDENYRSPPQWSQVYDQHCPHNTDPSSRHVKMICQSLRCLRSPMRSALAEFDPDHMASSMEATVIMLWESREKLKKLQEATEKTIADIRLFSKAFDDGSASKDFCIGIERRLCEALGKIQGAENG